MCEYKQMGRDGIPVQVSLKAIPAAKTKKQELRKTVGRQPTWPLFACPSSARVSHHDNSRTPHLELPAQGSLGGGVPHGFFVRRTGKTTELVVSFPSSSGSI